MMGVAGRKGPLKMSTRQSLGSEGMLSYMTKGPLWMDGSAGVEREDVMSRGWS